MKKALVLACLMALCLLTAGARAQEVRISNVTYRGGAERFVVLPGNGDLFQNFKKMMPGEQREQLITIRNEFDRPLHFYLRADEAPNGTVNVMLMDVLELSVRMGDTLLYEGSLADSLNKGGKGMGDDILLGRIVPGQQVQLTATLYAPGEKMDNRYMNLSTSIDWTITVMDLEPTPTPSAAPSPTLKPGSLSYGTQEKDEAARDILNVGDCFD